ncbi:MAG: alpha/beta hydrolase [Erysipelotrichaceae bacterium]|nr:alpha/beta hydrolase [Erysipelotrichaceae bacterium]
MKIIEFGKENKEVILFLHGGGLSWWDHKAEALALADRFHVVLPVLDGHADSDEAFVSIQENAVRLLSFIDKEYGGHVLCIGGLSLGAQILVEMLRRRGDICRYAIIESASVIPDRLTDALIGPAFSMSYGLIRKRWFAKLQAAYLRIPEELFEEYYRDTSKIKKEDMIAFLKASASYAVGRSVQKTSADLRIVVGSKEQKKMIGSAKLLQEVFPKSCLEIREGLHHGEYSIVHPDLYVNDLLRMIK